MWVVLEEGEVAGGTDLWTSFWGGQTGALLYLPRSLQSICVHLFCVVLYVSALFYHKNFFFNESTWDLPYLQSFRNLAFGECLIKSYFFLPFSLRGKL